MRDILDRALLLPLAIACLAAAPSPPMPANPPVLTADQWQEDLAAIDQEIRTRHPNPFNAVPQQQFESAVARLKADIPTLQRSEIIVGMMRIAAMVGDGHTRIDPRKDPSFQFPSLPLKFYEFDDGLFVRAARPDQRELLGAKIVKIGSIPTDQAVRRAGELVSADNAMGRKLMVPLYLAMPDVLQALGLSSARDAATFTLEKGGRTFTRTVRAGAVDPPWPPDTDISLITPDGWIDARKGAAPLYLSAPLDYHRLVALPDRKAVYAQLNMVADVDGETLGQFGRRIRDEAARIDARKVILDLRLNQGGNGALRYDFVSDLIRAEDEDTQLFVLTGRGTFSASEFILDDLDRLTHARFVGEPASSKPTSYGDSYKSKLPHSGLALRTSIYLWKSEQNQDPWVWTDIGAPLTFADYANGRDAALEAALAYVAPEPLDEQMLKIDVAEGAGGLDRFVRQYVSQASNRYANNAVKLANATEAAFDNGHRTEALRMAKATAAVFPSNLNVQFILAYVADQLGDKAAAGDAAWKVLAIDPDNRFIRQIAEKYPKR